MEYLGEKTEADLRIARLARSALFAFACQPASATTPHASRTEQAEFMQ